MFSGLFILPGMDYDLTTLFVFEHRLNCFEMIVCLFLVPKPGFFAYMCLHVCFNNCGKTVISLREERQRTGGKKQLSLHVSGILMYK